jgi:hypothetical protein
MLRRSLALACVCSLLAPVPALASPPLPFAIAQFGPDEQTVEAFEKVKKALAEYDAALAAGVSIHDAHVAANMVRNEAAPSSQSGEWARQHPDWHTIGARVDALSEAVQHIEACGTEYHPAMGVLSPAELKLYKAVEDHANLDGDTPELLAAGIERLEALTRNPAGPAAVTAMAVRYRDLPAKNLVLRSTPDFLAMVGEDLVHLAQADGPGAREDGKSLLGRLKAMQRLGLAATTKVVVSDNPLSPLEVTLAEIQATASRRAAGSPADDPLSRQARRVDLKATDPGAIERRFNHTYTKGKPKAQALVREHGYPTRVRTGPGGTWLWEYGYRRNGLDWVKTLTVSQKDGSLLSLKERLH